jgi:hypothetical protein
MDDWLKAIHQVFQNVRTLQKVYNCNTKQKIPLTDLYISKSYCLTAKKNVDLEAEKCLENAVKVSRDFTSEDFFKASLALAQYYENISEYQKMKKIIDRCYTKLYKNEKYKGNDRFQKYLAHALLLEGHYHFFKFRFRKSRKILMEAEKIFQSLLEHFTDKTDKTEESIFVHRKFNDCLHYIGRTYYEEYELAFTAKYYIKAQNILKKSQKKNGLTQEPEATAFYHLRLGQILETCKVQQDAMEHYNKSSELFQGSEIRSGLTQVNIAKANMIKCDSNYQYENSHEIFHKQEQQIKDNIHESKETGAYRVYLIGLLELFLLYLRNFKWHLALPLIWTAFTSDEFKKSGGVLLLYRYANKIIFNFTHKIKFIFLMAIKSDRVLYQCPCEEHKGRSKV